MERPAPYTKTFPERLVHAWGPLKKSFSFRVVGLVALIEMLLRAFEVESKLEQANRWPSWAPAAHYLLLCVGILYFVRGVFRLAEKNGETG